MSPQDIYEDIRSYCQANTDESRVKKYSRYFTEGYDAYGLSDTALKDKVDDILTDEGISVDLLLKTGDLLVQSGKYEETYFAILLMKSLADDFTPDLFQGIGRWFEKGIVNWAHCDVLCHELTSTFLKKRIIGLQAFDTWRDSENTYQRRAVPVAMLDLLNTMENYNVLFEFIEPLMLDREKKVQQGLGWFLREAWKQRKEETEAFLMKWKNKAPRVIFQYATEKMSKDERKRFRKEKQ
ncbi:DNA alkylation repair protein [Candidatus Latescibacterota bacterium]